MNTKQNKSHRIKDLVSIGIFTTLYFFMIGLSNVIVLFLIPGFSYIFVPVVAALLSGTIYMLLISKVPRFGAITTMGSLIGLFQLIIGLYPGAIFFCVIVSVLADLLAFSFQYRNKIANLASYVLFSFSSVGPSLPLLLFPAKYIEHLIGQGRSEAYIENAFAAISENTLFLLVASLLITATLGGLFGQRMMKKHFKKAGIV